MLGFAQSFTSNNGIISLAKFSAIFHSVAIIIITCTIKCCIVHAAIVKELFEGMVLVQVMLYTCV